jgi:hypothetical protein
LNALLPQYEAVMVCFPTLMPDVINIPPAVWRHIATSLKLAASLLLVIKFVSRVFLLIPVRQHEKFYSQCRASG